MNESEPTRRGLRRSQQVALVLLGTTGALGIALAWDSWRRAADPGSPPAAPGDPGAPIAADRVYYNNEYIPGVGYYHAPYRAWYPYPYNYHDPVRGYFAGGLWQTLPWAIALAQSRPSDAAVAAALAAQRQQRSAPSSAGGVGGGRYHGGWFSPSRSGGAPSEAAGHASISRGGFGGSAHGGAGE